jgi:hypothetical protein
MTPAVLRTAAILAIVLAALAILVGAYEGRVATIGPICLVVIAVALQSFRRLDR